MARRSLSPLWLTLVPVLAFVLIYGADVGHGFISDDFVWIKGGRFTGLAGLGRVFETHNGFYRPLVTLSFAVNDRLFGLDARAYGLTNVGLALATAAATAGLALALGLPRGAACLAGALWLLNPHGIGMSVLWISGRTSLLLTLFSVLCAWALLKGHRVLSALLCLLALLCKEEAVLLSFVLIVWTGWDASEPRRFHLRRAAARTWPLLVSLAAYFALRSRTTAYLPTTAPPFYRPSLDPAALLRNAVEYMDRSLTIGVAALLVLCLLAMRRPRPTPGEWHVVRLGLVWVIGGYGLTVFLPVRSSLYACFPSVGAALAAAALAVTVWGAASVAGRRRALVVAALVPVLVAPLYRRRNRRWIKPADVSAQVLGGLKGITIPPDTALVVVDEEGLVARAFGTLSEEALRLVLGRPDLHVWVEPPPAHWSYAGLRPVEPGSPAVRYRFRDGRLAPLP